MKNSIICKNCNSENPIYGLICNKCNSYLRERIFNIDLWHTISLLIENPKKGFTLIIQSEHKNFIFFISILAVLKLLIDSMFIALYSLKVEPVFTHFIRNYFIMFGEIILLLFILSLLFKIISNGFSIPTRVKDNFSIFTYSLLPHVFGVIFLLIIELTIFGGNIFSRNPSPFLLKQFLAYTLLGFELLLILWSIFLSFSAMLTQTRNILFSVISALLFNFVIYFCIYLNSYYLFN